MLSRCVPITHCSVPALLKPSPLTFRWLHPLSCGDWSEFWRPSWRDAHFHVSHIRCIAGRPAFHLSPIKKNGRRSPVVNDVNCVPGNCNLILQVLFTLSFFCLFCFFIQNQILWIDEKNLTAHVEAGIIGQDLERLVSACTLRFQAHPLSP